MHSKAVILIYTLIIFIWGRPKFSNGRLPADADEDISSTRVSLFLVLFFFLVSSVFFLTNICVTGNKYSKTLTHT